jgi:hypothetical protein
MVPVMREDRRAWTIVSVAGAAMLAVAVLAVERGPAGRFNFLIYRVFSFRYHITGRLPRADDSVIGMPEYADFTPMNLRVYEAFTGHWSLYIGYQLLWFLIGLGLLARYRQRLELSAAAVATMCAAVIVCGSMMLVGYEDKATFFGLVLLVAVHADGQRPVLFGALLGLLFGWTGLGLTALPLCLLHRERLRAALAVVGTASVCLSVAGGEVRLLFDNRFERENAEPFWYSVWNLDGPLWSPTLRMMLLIALSATILHRAWRRHTTGYAAVVALVAVTLLSSNNTDALRIAPFIPLGALCFASDAARIRWGVAATVWGGIVAADMAGVIAVMDDPTASGVTGVAWVLFVNLPLAVPIARVALHRQGVVVVDPINEVRPTAVGAHVAVVDTDEQNVPLEVDTADSVVAAAERDPRHRVIAGSGRRDVRPVEP